MFDVGWSELIVIAVVALIAIGPKELPGVLRMVGQWMTKIRRMAADFQGQFNEAMREAEMADIKKQFDEIKDTAKSFTGANLLSDAQKDFDDALKLEDKPEDTSADKSEDKPGEGTPAAEGTPVAAEPAASDASVSEQAEAKPDQPQAATTPDAAAASSAEPAAEPAAPAEASPEPAAVEHAAVAPDKPAPAATPQTETGAAKAS